MHKRASMNWKEPWLREVARLILVQLLGCLEARPCQRNSSQVLQCFQSLATTKRSRHMLASMKAGTSLTTALHRVSMLPPWSSFRLLLQKPFELVYTRRTRQPWRVIWKCCIMSGSHSCRPRPKTNSVCHPSSRKTCSIYIGYGNIRCTTVSTSLVSALLRTC